MSLHRVQSLESWDRRSRDASPAALEHRTLTFNPAEGTKLPALPGLDQQPVSAIEVSRLKRVVQIVAACVSCLLSAGVVFGYAAFKPVLVREGVYGELCTPDDPGSIAETCTAQEIRLNLMFTTAAVVTNVAALPVGTLLDKYGPRASSLIGAFFLALGSAFFMASRAVSFDVYLPGYLFLALGGPFIYISSFQLSNCFPRHSGLILALLTGAFDTSSAVLPVFRFVYDASLGFIAPPLFFTVYLLVPVFVVLVQVFIMPAQSYKTVGAMVQEADEVDEDDLGIANLTASRRANVVEESRMQRRESVLSEIAPLLTKDERATARSEEERKKRISGVWGVLHGLSAFQQIKTPWWILIALFTSFQMTRINFFIATIRSQYTFLFDSYSFSDSLAIQVNDFFDVALPAGGVVAIPFIGLILDNTSTPVTLALLVAVATLIGILGILPSLGAAYANVILFVLYRPFYYTAVSDYTAKVFGFHTFGKVYGLIICFAGLFNFSQSGLDALTHGVFRGDPRPANAVLMLAVLLVGSVLAMYAQRKKKAVSRVWLEVEADEASERLMPDPSVDDGYDTDTEARRGRDQIARELNGTTYGTTS